LSQRTLADRMLPECRVCGRAATAGAVKASAVPLISSSNTRAESGAQFFDNFVKYFLETVFDCTKTGIRCFLWVNLVNG
jgi:hypothetical protein